MIDSRERYGPGKPLPHRIGPPCCYRDKPDNGVVLMLANMFFAFLLFVASGAIAKTSHEELAGILFLASLLQFFVGTPLISRLTSPRKRRR